MPRLRSDWVKGGLSLGLGLLVYLTLAYFLSSAAEPRPEVTLRAAPDVDFTPANKVERTRMVLHKAGFEYECMECHFNQSRSDAPRAFIGEHSELKFDHGINQRCFNCHHPTEVDKFITTDGRPMDYTRHVALCAGCHGPTYRDWKNGAHGRRAGHWDPSKGPQERADCVICHDPHHPKFTPIAPLPPPSVFIGEPHAPLRPHSYVGRLKEAEPPKPKLREAVEIPVEEGLQ